MRYNIISLGCAFAAAVCISCNKESVAELPLQTFRAESPDTRTTLSGTSILWMPSDEISLYKGKQCIEKNIPEEQAGEELLELISTQSR